MIELLKGEGLPPPHFASLGWVVAAKMIFGASDEQILIATLYKAAHFHKTRAEILQNEIEEWRREAFFNERLLREKDRGKLLADQHEILMRNYTLQERPCADLGA